MAQVWYFLLQSPHIRYYQDIKNGMLQKILHKLKFSLGIVGFSSDYFYCFHITLTIITKNSVLSAIYHKTSFDFLILFVASWSFLSPKTSDRIAKAISNDSFAESNLPCLVNIVP